MVWERGLVQTKEPELGVVVPYEVSDLVVAVGEDHDVEIHEVVVVEDGFVHAAECSGWTLVQPWSFSRGDASGLCLGSDSW